MYIPRLKKHYREVVVPELQKRMGYSSPMAVPKILAICINQGVARHKDNRRLVDNLLDTLTLIAGQKAIPTYAKKAISNFKLRAGMIVGGRVTLRGDRMYEFSDLLFNFSLPQVRDFQGLSIKSFDKQFNYTIGLKEQIVFPQVNVDKVGQITGLNITFVTNATTYESSYWLLRELGMPFADLHKKKK